MCGILAWWHPKNTTLRNNFEKALLLQSHRGPDYTGVDYQDDIWLGHNRLSIIDLSSSAHQPMKSASGRYTIIFNGEIYNYLELKEELLACGQTFLTNSDTEIILAAYDEWGLDAINKFNGMWAFVLWDNSKEICIISRDRFSIKPLYYMQQEDGYLFASEIKPLLSLSNQKPQANYDAIGRFFYDGNIDGQDETWFKNIYRFPAAHSLVLTPTTQTWHRYWDFNATPSDRTKFSELIQDAVDKSLRSDVPLGVCLSGGIDSSTVSSLAAKRQPISSFTARHTETISDEYPFVEQLVKDKPITPYAIFPDQSTLFEDAAKILWHLEEPAKATGVFSQWHVMQLASENVKVLLDGQGGDEIFAGYQFQYIPFLKGLFRSKQWSLLRQTVQFYGYKRSSKQLKSHAMAEAKNILRPFLRPLWHRINKNSQNRIPWTETFFKTQLAPKFKTVQRPPLNKLHDRLKWDIQSEMLPALLRNEDKLSMAFSLESRVPLLDYRLVERSFSTAAHDLIKNGWTKFPLRNVLSNHAPEGYAWRKEKLGFPTPFNSYFLPHKNQIIAWLESGAMVNHGILDPQKVKNTIESAIINPHDRLVWHLLQTEWWLRNFIDGDFTKPINWTSST